MISDGFPSVVQAERPDLDAVEWAAANQQFVDDRLLDHGALLFRGFPIESAAKFQQFVRAVAGEPLEYRERSSPRHQVVGNVYTSTDYPPAYEIFLHNESSYSAHWPLRLLFYCDTPPASGGETPLASVRRITREINPRIRQRFVEEHIKYVRNFRSDVGLPWTTVFGTTDKSDVERYCREAGIAFEWRSDDELRTEHIRPAVQRHPRTGEELWFNHATFFHATTLDSNIRDALVMAYGEDDLPNNTYYGDGSPIEPETLDHLRAVYRANLTTFPWRKDDVLLIDNMLVAHGRRPYSGARKIVVAMTELIGDPTREIQPESAAGGHV